MRWLVGATDWSTAGILALIVLADGLRRAPPDAVLVRKFGTGPWAVVPGGPRQPRLTLVSWGAPFVSTLLVRKGGAGIPDNPWLERYERLRRRLPAVRLLAGAGLLLVVIGIPIGAAAAGSTGFLAAVIAVLAVTLTTAVLSLAWARPLAGQSPAVGWAAHLLSPFTTPRAAELLLERCGEGQSQLALLRVLLPADSFEAWVRPRAFDRIGSGAGPDTELDLVLDRDALRALLARPPAAAGEGDPYCPRCGGVYAESSDRCADCDVALVRRVPSGATRPF